MIYLILLLSIPIFTTLARYGTAKVSQRRELASTRCKITQESTGLFIGRRECRTHDTHWDDDTEECPSTWEADRGGSVPELATPLWDETEREIFGFNDTERWIKETDSVLKGIEWERIREELKGDMFATGPVRPEIQAALRVVDHGEYTEVRSWDGTTIRRAVLPANSMLRRDR